MVKVKKEPDSRLNSIFAEAFDELKRNHGITTQLQLAEKMGVNKDTITRILKGYTPVTEESITKLQTASGCIFNLQWLRGNSNIMLAKDLPKPQEQQATVLNNQNLDLSSMINAIIAAKDETIASKNQQIEKLQELVDTKEQLLQTTNQTITNLQEKIQELTAKLAEYKTNNFCPTLGVAEDNILSK